MSDFRDLRGTLEVACDATQWRRVARLSRMPVARAPRRAGHPPLPNPTATVCWFLASMHVLSCHTQFVEVLSDAVLSDPACQEVAAWIPVHAAAFGGALTSYFFVTRAQRVRDAVPRFVDYTEFEGAEPSSTAAHPLPNSLASAWTSRSWAAFILLLHITGRPYLREAGARSAALTRLVLEAVPLREGLITYHSAALEGAAALSARHVYASPADLFSAMFTSGGRHPLSNLLNTPAFQLKAGIATTSISTFRIPEGCIAKPDTHETLPSIPLVSVGESFTEALSIMPQTVCRIDGNNNGDVTASRSVTWLSDWMICTVEYVDPSRIPRYTTLHNPVKTSDGVNARVIAVAARPAGQAHFVALLRVDVGETPDGWYVLNDDNPVQRVHADEHTFHDYEVVFMILKKDSAA